MIWGQRLTGQYFGQHLGCLTRCTSLARTPASNVARRFLQTERYKIDYRSSYWNTRTFVILSSVFVVGAGLKKDRPSRFEDSEKRKKRRLKEEIRLSNRITRGIEVWQDFSRAEELANILSVEYGTQSGLVMVAKEAANLGKFDFALRVAGNISCWMELGTKEYIVEKIFDSGGLDKALEIANRISDKYYKLWALEYIAKKVADSGGLDKALEIANRISSESYKSSALEYIAKKVADSGDLDKALEIANRISDEYCKSSALEYIVEKVAKSGDLDKALKVVNEIPNNRKKSLALESIVEIIADHGDLDKALEIANRISDECCKSSALEYIAKRVAKSGDLDKALEIANRISDEYRKSSALQYIAKRVAKSGDLDKALETARRIDCRPQRTSALVHITRKMVDLENFEHVLEMINEIEWSRDNSSDLTYVLERTIEFQGFDQTFELIDKVVTEEKARASVFSFIAIKAVDIKGSEYSLEIVDLIPKKYRGLWVPVFEHIVKKEVGSKNFDRALEIVKMISPHADSLLCYISCAMADFGELDRALDLALSIRSRREYREKAIDYVSEFIYEKNAKLSVEIGNPFN